MTPCLTAITLMLLSLQHTQGHVANDCIARVPPFKDQGVYSPMLLAGIQALVPAYEISCDGTVVKWKLATVRDGQHGIDLQVWRPQSEAGSYTLIGANRFVLKPSNTQRLFSLTPKDEDLISAQKGDVLGFYMHYNKSDDFSIQYQPNYPEVSVIYRQLYQTIRTITPHTLPVELINAAPIINADIDAGIEGNTNKTTTMDTSFKETTPVTSNTSNSTPYTIPSPKPTQAPHNSQLTLIIATVLAATLGTTCLMLTVVALVVCCRKGNGHTAESKKGVSSDFDEEDSQYTRAVIIPPPMLRKHDIMFIAAVPLKNNPIYEQIPSAHEYETPVLLYPQQPRRLPTGYDTPRRHQDYENI